MRGCPYGAYFSSNASTLPAAEETGNMTLRPHSIVHEIIYDDDLKKATGVRVIDANTKEKIVFNAKVIFSCASTVGSTSILLQSKSERFPNGLGNDSGELGHNLMDHHTGAGANGKTDNFKDKYYKGGRPNGIYIPRFRNLGNKETKKDYLRGFGYQGAGGRKNSSGNMAKYGYGAEFKEKMLEPGDWTMGLGGFGECLPYHENKMTLNYEKLDEWDLPTVTFDAELKENEFKMREDIAQEAVEMLEKAGFKDVKPFNYQVPLGMGIHEMGTARMGKDPKTSILNGNNQIHTVPNVYVTDGSCMTSSGCQNPSLTYMAITARAANHAADQIINKKI